MFDASALLNEKPSPFDLRWRMFGTHVRVKWMFWLVIGIFGFISAGSQGWLAVLMFVLAAFLSVMVHEFGHIAAGRIFGFPGVIVLHKFGGGAIGEYGRALPWQRIIIALAGPAAGALFYLAICATSPWFWTNVSPRLNQFNPAVHNAVVFLYSFLIFMGLFWTVFNLLPVLPQDGGMVVKDVVYMILGRRGEKVAYLISFVSTLAVMWWCWQSSRDPSYTSTDRFFELAYPDRFRWFRGRMEPTFAIIMYGILAFQSLMMLIRRDPPPEASGKA